jgi:hypothetical protein
VNLRESLIATAEQMPDRPSGVDLDGIVSAHRRSVVRRRVGAALAVVALLAAGPIVGPMVGASGRAGPAVVGAPVGPVSGPPSRPGPAVARLTAADLGGAVPAYGSAVHLSFAEAPARVAYMSLTRRTAAHDPLLSDPCALPPGASPGRRGAPTPADRCTRVVREGRTVWVRRWGYAPRERPGVAPAAVVIEVFFRLRTGRGAVLALSNVELPVRDGAGPATTPGPPFDITDTELAALVLGLD